jgi:hypothetical protein
LIKNVDEIWNDGQRLLVSFVGEHARACVCGCVCVCGGGDGGGMEWLKASLDSIDDIRN